MKNFYFIFLAFLVIGCNTSNSVTQNSETNDPSAMDFSYLALGDSYTIGESVPENKRWPVQLVAQLNERGYKVAPPKIIAKTGWTSGNLLAAMRSELNYTREFDLVSILIGVNNQYQGQSIEDYEEELREIFKLALNHSKRREKGVFALSIPDYGVTPFGQENAETIGEEIDEFNAVFRQVALEFEVDFYNITPISREAERDAALIAEDGLHPSGLMYRYWVEEIIDEIPQMLPQ
ncbi:SGNH/GDSL hydrolase family protein [Salegentibacter salegens]|uniref:Lysophospholipase L1 n=1 Tax=Salegentibacter salegens TaxID=143223 RepID=A0A1M7NH60_9FLAO|nr:SGNH/GDSL hydrolase family protein [Salegentibacter salegens]PRX46265.1 lysophospholipase L1-like esterase [Salegentibacter salegens]SHN02599.1 Lysophospholipase L1 [Salegentibacter salegens]